MPIRASRLSLPSRLALSTAVVLVLLTPIVCPPSTVHADAAFVVDSTADTFLMGSPDGICNDGTGHCTLREALIEAYYASGNKTITFSSSILPATIDLVNGALTLPGNDTLIDGPGTDSLTINGDGLGPGSRVVEITGNDNTVRHLTIDGARSTGIIVYEESSAGGASGNSIEDVVITGSTNSGVWLHAFYGVGGDGNTVSNSLIGVGDWSTTACVESERNGSGISLSGQVRNSHIQGNRVVCNGSMGVDVGGTSVSGTHITGNQIGTDGTHAMSNGFYGLLSQGADTEISGNLVSGNGDIGVWVNAGDGVQVVGNKIGTDQTGTAAVPNGGDGIHVGSLAKNVVIGSATDAAARNIISGNGQDGIQLQVGPSSGNGPLVNGNIIGLNASGTAALPNARYGLNATYQTLGMTIGADSATVDQLISGNGSSGLRVQYSQNVHIGTSNYIGVAADHSTPLGNSGDGIEIGWSSDSTVTPAVIAHNGGGASVTGDSTSGVMIRPLDVHGNSGLPVDLVGLAGHDPNDPGDADTGPNGLLNYPEITAAEAEDISGSACLGCLVFIYEAIGDPVAAGGGGAYLMQVTADLSTGAWNATLPAGLTAQDVTLMASESPSPGDTSEMSPLYTAPHFQLFLPLVLRHFP